MRRFFAIGFALVTLMALGGAIGLGVLLARFDPNNYKRQFQAALEEATGWKITLHDKLSMRFLPNITLHSGPMSVTIPESGGRSAHMQGLTLKLSGTHLHQGFLDVEEILVHELNMDADCVPVSLLPHDGRNPAVEAALRALLAESRSGPAAPIPMPPGTARESGTKENGIEGIRLKVRYPGKKLTLESATLTGKREKGEDPWVLFLSKAELANLALNSDVSVSLKGEYTDPLQVKKASFSLEGSAKATSTGILQSRIASLHARLEGLGDLPLDAAASMDLRYSPRESALSLNNIQGTLGLAQTRAVSAGSEETKPAAIQGNVTIMFPREGSAKGISGNLHASSLNLDLLLHGLDPAVRFVESTAGGIKGAPNFTRPKVTRVFTSATATQLKSQKGPGAARKTGGLPAWVQVLADRFPLNLSFKADRIVCHGLPLENLALRVGSSAGRAAAPFSFRLFNGDFQGTASLNALGAQPAVGLVCTVTGVHMGKLSGAWISNYYIGGVGSGFVEINGQGRNALEIVNSLRGIANFKVQNGEVRGFKLIPPDVPYFQNLPENFLFYQLSAGFRLENGKASTSDILLESGTLNGKGFGIAHLALGQLDLRMDFTQQGQGATVPVLITGPYASLHNSVDMTAYNRTLDQLGLGAYDQEYYSPYYDGRSGVYGAPGIYGPGVYADPYARGGYYNHTQGGYQAPRHDDPYRRFLNQTPGGNGMQWRDQQPQPPYPPAGGTSGRHFPVGSGKIAPMRNPADIIYGRE